MTKTSHPHHRIELKLREMSQLFNSMDPSPFNEKDLDQNAEAFIENWAHEYPVHDPINLRIHLEQKISDESTTQIREAIHHFFQERAKFTKMELGRMFRQGRVSLMIAVVFMALCFLLIHFVAREELLGAWNPLVREGLTIAGWVAMWRPMEVYLYDWWPIRARQKIYEKLGHMPIEIVQVPGSFSGSHRGKARI